MSLDYGRDALRNPGFLKKLQTPVEGFGFGASPPPCNHDLPNEAECSFFDVP